MTKALCKLLINKRAYVFDLDGTLIDSVEAHVKSWLRAVKAVFDIDLDFDRLTPLIGLGGKQIIQKLLGLDGLRKYKTIRWFKDRYFLYELRNNHVTVFPATLRILELLKSVGFKVGVATSTPTYMALHILDFLGISKYVDVMICGDEVRNGKPAPDIFAKNLDALSVEPRESIIVGDTIFDAIPALSLGAPAILVNSKHLPDSLKNKVIALESIEELLSTLSVCL